MTAYAQYRQSKRVTCPKTRTRMVACLHRSGFTTSRNNIQHTQWKSIARYRTYGATYTRPLSLLRPTAFNVFSATANIVDFMTKSIFMPTVKSLLQLYSVFDFNFLQSSLFVSPPALRKAQARRAYVLLMFKKVLVISVRTVISTSTVPIFAEFAGMVELYRAER